jgi:hypothetical protein
VSAHRRATILVTWCALSLAPAVAAQPTTIIPVQDLAFGTVEPFLATVVSPTDAGARAEVRVRGRGSFIAQFTLPSALDGPGGATFPLSFGPADAIMRAGGSQTVFDPTQPFPYSVGTSGNPNRDFFLGGTAGPAPGAPNGAYSAVITLTIIQAGA